MLIIKLLSGLALIGSVAWFIAQRDYEPAITMLTSFSAFVAALIVDKKQKWQANQNQSVSKNGIGIQSGGDINLGSIRKSGKNPGAE